MEEHQGLDNTSTHKLPQPSRQRKSQRDFNSLVALLKGSIEIQSKLKQFQAQVLTFRLKDSELNLHSRLQTHHF
jgi:hypothetical protein